MFNTLLVYPLLNILLAIYALLPFHDFGVAVIILTVIIRLILWPIVGKQLHSQKKLQQLQPEIARIKKETKGDKQKESQMMMELYKEKEINPLSSCLPLVIQLPFLFALFVAFRDASGSFSKVVPHLYSWVANLPYIKELIANPAAFKPMLFRVVNMAKPNLILAVIAGITQFIQARQLQPKREDVVDQAAQLANSMTLLFPILTVVIALRLPSALALYWITTTLLAILQQWLILRRETEIMEEDVKVTKRIKS